MKIETLNRIKAVAGFDSYLRQGKRVKGNSPDTQQYFRDNPEFRFENNEKKVKFVKRQLNKTLGILRQQGVKGA